MTPADNQLHISRRAVPSGPLVPVCPPVFYLKTRVQNIGYTLEYASLYLDFRCYMVVPFFSETCLWYNPGTQKENDVMIPAPQSQGNVTIALVSVRSLSLCQAPVSRMGGRHLCCSFCKHFSWGRHSLEERFGAVEMTRLPGFCCGVASAYLFLYSTCPRC